MKRLAIFYIILSCCGWTHGSAVPPPAATINVAGLTNGTQTVNGLSPTCFTNPADTVGANTTWTTASTKYLVAPTTKQFIIEGISGCNWRDVEFTNWTHQGYVYLRLDASGNAIYFLHDGSTTNGTLEIGMVTGLNESSYPGGTYYPFYSNTDLVHTVTGYTTTSTDGQFFTFGVSGFTYYVKFGKTNTAAVQILSFQDYRQMSSAAVAMKSNGGGFRGDSSLTPSTAVAFNPLSLKSLYSNYAAGQLDLRDFGLRSTQTTGTITGGTNSLAVTSSAGFQLNDYVIVEIGGESGVGARGTAGAGGQWPALSYANATAMNADIGQTQYTFAWTQNDGVVYEWSGSAWSTTFSCPTCATNIYYGAKAVPMSLVARITNIVGNTITLDTNASATATNAAVYVDNELILNDLVQPPRTSPSLAPITPSNLTLIFPTGTYAFAGYTAGFDHTGWTIQGAGSGSTTLYSAKGTFGAGIVVENMPSMKVQNLTLSGNIGGTTSPTGYGLNWAQASIGPIPSSTASTEYNAAGVIRTTTTAGTVTQTAFPGSYFATAGITFQLSDNSQASNLVINNIFTNAVQCLASANCGASSVTVNMTYQQRSYTQWTLEFANSTGGYCTNCTIIGAYLGGGIECFAPTSNTAGPTWTSLTLVNAGISFNDCGGATINGGSQTFQANADAPGWSHNNGMVQIDGNTGTDRLGNNTIENFTLAANYIDNVSKDISTGFVITSDVPATTITNVTYTGPGYVSGTSAGNRGINSQGSNTALTSFKACGATQSGDTNIEFSTGTGNSLVTSIYDTITLNGASNTSPTHPCP